MIKHIIGLVFILALGLTSCEGRTTAHQALAQSIEDFKKNATLEVNVFIPESYVEHEVDTLLSNGYHVKIKTFTDMTNNVLFSKIKDTVNYQTHYRSFKFDISVSKNNTLIYNESFDKQRFYEKFKAVISTENLSNKFEDLAVLKAIELNDNLTTDHKVEVDILYTIPEYDTYFSYNFSIDEKGTSEVTLLEHNY